jgi:hypothetical protein
MVLPRLDSKGVDVMAVPGRLRAEGRDRKIMWRGSQGSGSAERHVILPDLQNEPIVFHKKLGEGGFSTVYRCAIGPLTCALDHAQSPRLACLQLTTSHVR